jgi:hypothetical protein
MEIWDHTRLQAERRFRGLDADMQPPTACREDEGNRVRSVVPKLIARTESRMCPRERQPSSKSQDWAVTWRQSARERGGGRRTFVGARLRKGTRKKPIVVRETKEGVGARACVLPEMHKCPRAPCGRKHSPGSGLDVFRVRSGLRVQRSHRRTLST